MIIIRSQSKGVLAKPTAVYIEDKRIIADPEEFILGDYANCNRCLEIIDEIETHIACGHTGVYQMPEE